MFEGISSLDVAHLKKSFQEGFFLSFFAVKHILGIFFWVPLIYIGVKIAKIT